jgi:sugar-phosphatase
MTILTCSGVLFDLDGVLADSTAGVERHWLQFAERMGLPADDVLRVAHGSRSIDVITRLVPAAEIEAQTRWFDELEIDDVADVVALPGAIDLLGDLPPPRWAVVTSCGHDLALARLRAAGLPEPRHLVSGDQVAAGKPDPEGYLLGAGRLGIVAGDAVVFEDAPPGAEAGRRAGATVVALETTHRRDEVAADRHIGDLRDVAVVGSVGSFLELELS